MPENRHILNNGEAMNLSFSCRKAVRRTKTRYQPLKNSVKLVWGNISGYPWNHPKIFGDMIESIFSAGSENRPLGYKMLLKWLAIRRISLRVLENKRINGFIFLIREQPLIKKTPVRAICFIPNFQ